MRSLTIAIVLVLVAGLGVATAPPASGAGGEGETWPTFSESSACGWQRIPTPLAPRSGWLPLEMLLRGPSASYFGRSVEQVRSDLVRWSIPGSSEVLLAHERMLPALHEVEAAIAASGEQYRIRPSTTYSTAARTIAGNVRISRHTFGVAFDFNAHANPYRRDNTFISDMPDWWISAFTDAGFCWGGEWIGSKDTMHFAWQGPAPSGYEELAEPYAPLTDPAPLGRKDRSIAVVPRQLPGTIATLLVDVDGNAARDVVRLVSDGGDVIVDASVASRGHNACSDRRSSVAGLGRLPRSAIATGFGDWDARGGNDLWFATDDRGRMRLTVRWAYGGYSAETAATTGVPTPSSEAWVSTGDHDVDGDLDLFVIDQGTLTVWDVDPDTGATSLLLETDDPFPGVEHRFIGDRDLDQQPDIWAIDDATVRFATAADGYAVSPDVETPLGLPSTIVASAASDYDGDGRTDLVVFDGSAKHVWLANTRLPDGLPLETWFEYPDAECQEGEATWDRTELRFSTSNWVGVGSYAWRSAQGFPVGCDPEDEGCEAPPVRVSSLAEFFAWIDGLDAVPGPESLAAIRAVEAAGYSLPCSSWDDGCATRLMLKTEVSVYFGQFLADRRGDVPPPHRWVTPTPVTNGNGHPR